MPHWNLFGRHQNVCEEWKTEASKNWMAARVSTNFLHFLIGFNVASISCSSSFSDTNDEELYFIHFDILFLLEWSIWA